MNTVMAQLDALPFKETLAERLAAGPGEATSLYWLGQAGFVIDAGGRRLVIDPYLSDSLARKYRGTRFPHERMAPAPVTPEELGHVDLVLVTHHHTDHMDGETLSALASRLPALQFVVPAASVALAMERIGADISRLIPVTAGDRRRIGGITIDVFPAAHEIFEQNSFGWHRFLGYGIEAGSVRIFHSGDTVPYQGQAEELRTYRPDLALLPVNGRRLELSEAGIAGNLSIGEAVNLCEQCEIPFMLAHHYGMFAFNTVPAAEIDAATETAAIRLRRADWQTEYRLAPG